MKTSTILMCLFWGVMYVLGVIEVLFYTVDSNQIYIVASTVITMFLTLIWFIEDSRNINHIPSFGLKISVAIVSFIAVPYYLIRYKGWRRSLLSLSIFLGWLLLYVIVVHLADITIKHTISA